jgi:subtilisin-like proprotein convertase family protein
METTWDGGVLEISINGNAFQDIISAGGAFLSGGYTHDLNFSTNPIGGRRAWSGATPATYISTSVRLPANTFGQNVRFRWIFGSNDNFAVEGWRIDNITVETVPTASNTNSISISNVGTANPYPSGIQVAGLVGFVTGVSVSLEDFSHDAPDDVDILLVAPNGRRMVLMSDVGGTAPVSNIDLAFTDTAASFLPDNTHLAGGVFKPTDFENNDTFPSPAPQTTTLVSTLSGFYGTNPNGTWQLYIVDDNGNNAGTISGGWSLDVQSSITACIFSLSPTVQAFSAGGGNGSFQINIPTGCAWAVSTTANFVTLTSSTSGEGASSLSFSVAQNLGAARTGLISINDTITTRTFQIQQSSGCPFALGQTNLSFTASGGNGIAAVTAGAGCTWQAMTNANWIQITSPQQNGNGNVTFTVSPNTSRNARSASVIIGAQTLTVNQAGASTARFDFDGDSKADISVYRNGTWFLIRSSVGTSVQQFGLANDKLAPADFDNDGKTDLAVFRDGTWYILRSSDSQVSTIQFGISNDIPVPADFDGDGQAELAVFRNGSWFVLNLTNNQFYVAQFGLSGDKPVTADYDGDGKADLAVYRNGTWFLQQSTGGFAAVQFGIAIDKPVVGDYDGDGKADLAVYRNGEWHILGSLQGYSVTQFGLATDSPTAADYDGDGKTDIAVFREGVWYILRSTQGFLAVQFGIAADKPVPNVFVP